MDIGEYDDLSDCIDGEMENALVGEAGAKVIAGGYTWTSDGTTWTRPQPTVVIITDAGTQEIFDLANLNAAIASAADGATIKLNADCAAPSTVVVPAGKTLVLDLNGHTLVSTVKGYTLDNQGNLTIIGSSEDKTGVVDHIATGTASTVRNLGSLTLSDVAVTGNYIGIKNGEGAGCSGGKGYGELVIDGGTYAGGGPAAGHQAVQNWGKATINGGTFNGCVCSWSYSGSEGNIAGELVISGGDFDAAVVAQNYDAEPAESAKVTIKGGRFDGDVYSAFGGNIDVPAKVVVDDVEVFNPAEFKDASYVVVADEGYEFVLDEDGYYVVQEAAPPAPAAAFIIQVVGATAVTNDNVVTFSVPEGKTLAVYKNGVASNEATLDISTPPANDVLVVAAAVDAIPAVGHKWFENATLVGYTGADDGSDGCGGWNASIDRDGNWVNGSVGFTGQSAYISKISDLVAGEGAYVEPVRAVPNASIGGSLRGGGISLRWNVALYGNLSTDGIKVLPLNGGDAMTVKLFALDGTSYVGPDAFCFSPDGSYFWANCYSKSGSASRANIYKFVVPAGGFKDGLELTAVDMVSAPSRVRGMKVAYVGGEEYIYCKDDTGLFKIKTSDKSSVKLNSNAHGGPYPDYAVAGSHAYVFNYSTTAASIDVFDLDPATGWFADGAAPVATVDMRQYFTSGTGIWFDVTDNEETMIFVAAYTAGGTYSKRTIAFQYTTPPPPPGAFIIQVVGAAAVTNDNVVTFSVPEGKTLAVYKNGVASDEATLDISAAPASDVLVVAAAVDAIPAVGHKWYENATVVGKVGYHDSGDGCGGWNATIDRDGNWINGSVGFSGQWAFLTKVSDLVAGNGGDVDPVREIKKTDVGGSIRGGGISLRWNVALYGNAISANYVKALPLNGGDAFDVKLLAADGTSSFAADAFCFSPDGSYFWANCYLKSGTASRANIYKFEVPAGGFKPGLELTAVEVISAPSRVRGMKVAYVGGEEYIYCKDDTGLFKIKTSDKSSVKLNSNAHGGPYPDYAVAGSHVYVFNYSVSAASIDVFDLDPATGWFADGAAPVANVDMVPYLGGTTTGIWFDVTENEETMIFITGYAPTNEFSKRVIAFQYTTPAPQGPTWPASWTEGKGTEANLAALDAWMQANGLADADLTAALEGNFLMGAPATADVSTGLKITSIAAGDVIVVEVESNVEGVALSDAMPGVVVLKGANDLEGTWTVIDELEVADGVATFNGTTTYKFFKAFIDYPAPEAE